MSKKINQNTYRDELRKIMPNYDWTVHRNYREGNFAATGKMCSGFNRISTLSVCVKETDSRRMYSARIAGYGAKTPYGEEFTGRTLAQALRSLQRHHECMEAHHRAHVRSLQYGRGKTTCWMGAE